MHEKAVQRTFPNATPHGVSNMERVPHRATQIVAAGAASASPSKPLLPLFTDAMVSRLNRTLYKGRQFAKNYEEAPGLDEADFQRMKRQMGNHLP